MGSRCELKESTGDREADLAVAFAAAVGGGGGVKDIARGLLRADTEGEVTGDDGSTACGRPNMLRTVSSSEGPLCSTSLSSDERKEGGSSVGGGD